MNTVRSLRLRRRREWPWRWLAALALFAGALTGGQAQAGQFAASALPAAPATGTGVLRSLLALLLVLALILGAAWLLRRLRSGVIGGNQELRLLAQLSVGQRERVVLIRARDRELLLGVAAGSVRTLLAIESGDTVRSTPRSVEGAVGAGPEAAEATDRERPSFRALLLRSLGR